MRPEDDWVRLHPFSPVLDAGKVVFLGGLLAVRIWADSIEAGSALAPGLRLVLLALGVLIAGGVVALAYGAVAWRFRRYRLASTLVEHRTGVLFRTHRQLPFDRIESVDTAQPFIPRLLGLAEVRVRPMSGHDQDVRLRYLLLADAIRLRDLLAARRTGAGADPIVTASAPLLVVPVWELVLGYGILPVARVAVGAVVIALGVAVLAGPGAALGVVVISGIFFLVPAVVAAVVRIENLWGFRLDDGPDALVIHRGLLNLSTQRIHTGRVQAIRIDQPLTWRPVRRRRLVVDVASHRGADKGSVAGELLPIAPDPVVRYVLQRLEVRADIEAVDFAATPRRARWRSWRASSMALARTPTHLLVRSGVLWRRVSIVPHDQVQSARITQGRWQRPLRLASVHVDTAGARIHAVAHHRDQQEAISQAEASARAAAEAVAAHG